MILFEVSSSSAKQVKSLVSRNGKRLVEWVDKMDSMECCWQRQGGRQKYEAFS